MVTKASRWVIELTRPRSSSTLRTIAGTGVARKEEEEKTLSIFQSQSFFLSSFPPTPARLLARLRRAERGLGTSQSRGALSFFMERRNLYVLLPW